MSRGAWWHGWMRRIRWTDDARHGRHRYLYSDDLKNDAPACWCGATMLGRAGYLMGGERDWMMYACPHDRPWNFWRHAPWTIVWDVRSIVRWANERKQHV